MMRIVGSLLIFILLCFGAAALGGLLTASAVPTWYAALKKPAWNPPNWMFGPVWTILYLMMAVAAWRVWLRRPDAPVGLPLTLFAVQLLLNALWTPIFFGLHWVGVAFVEILLLWAAVLATGVTFAHVSPLAAWLLAPYLLWVTFAAFLNYTIWRLNP